MTKMCICAGCGQSVRSDEASKSRADGAEDYVLDSTCWEVEDGLITQTGSTRLPRLLREYRENVPDQATLITKEEREPYNPELHAALVVGGFTALICPEVVEDVGGPESGPRVHHESGRDEYAGHGQIIVIDKTRTVVYHEFESALSDCVSDPLELESGLSDAQVESAMLDEYRERQSQAIRDYESAQTESESDPEPPKDIEGQPITIPAQLLAQLEMIDLDALPNTTWTSVIDTETGKRYGVYYRDYGSNYYEAELRRVRYREGSRISYRIRLTHNHVTREALVPTTHSAFAQLEKWYTTA